MLDLLSRPEVLVVRDVHGYQIFLLSFKYLFLVFIVILKFFYFVLVQNQLSFALIDLPDVVNVLKLKPHVLYFALYLLIFLLVSSDLSILFLPVLCLFLLF